MYATRLFVYRRIEMAKFRRIPKEIDAIQFDPVHFLSSERESNKFYDRIEYVGHNNGSGYFKVDCQGYSEPVTITENDYLVDMDGNFYVVDEQTFKSVYEEVQ